MWWLETTGYHLAGLVWLIVIAVAFLIALIALIVAGSALARANTARRMVAERPTYVPTPQVNNAVDPAVADTALAESARVLHDRYARGEISREEYLQRRDDLSRAEMGVLTNGAAEQNVLR